MCGFIPSVPFYEYQAGLTGTNDFVAGSLGVARDNLATSWKQDFEVLFGYRPESSAYALTAAASVKKNIAYSGLNHLSAGPRAHVSYLGEASSKIPVEAGLAGLVEYSHFKIAFNHLGVIAIAAGPGYAYNFSSHEGYPTFNVALKVGWVTN